MSVKIAVLGGGLAGLELGRRLNEQGKDFVVLEKEPRTGGLCRTNTTGPYRWDFAVHAIYSRSQEAMDFFCSLPLDYQYSDRNVKIVHRKGNGRTVLLDYPFENGIRDLPIREKLECVLGYVFARRKKDVHTLAEWIESYSGFGTARHFMVPYNRKIWNCPLSEISSDLVSVKIEPAAPLEFMKNVFWKKEVGRAYQAKFIYPREGVQALTDHIGRDIQNRVVTNAKVSHLRQQNGRWGIFTTRGQKFEADTVISTIPLPELLRAIEMEGIRSHYDQLRWNHTFFIMVGLKDGARFRMIDDCHWVFFKGDEVFYRLTLMHNFSNRFPAAAVAEITDKGRASGMSPEEMSGAVVNDLMRIGVLRSAEDVQVTDIRRVEYTYMIPTLGLAEVKKGIKDTLEARNVFLLGRNGNWEYLNMDNIVLRVRDFVRKNFLG
ncbi:MAG: NAD(P)-binding protein [Candidatus Omnitrophica bacterium]|nr:NAD(P)-binding protein [Candidatus Omnitrophota bacterium]